jgi:predicted AAA+ superfamily ATPase
MLNHLTDAFLLSTVPLATDSERQRNSNPRKIYPADPGLIPAFDASGRVNLGHSLETAVLNELDRRRAETGYVKTADGLEVDFLVRNRDADHELIQVCANLQSSETVARELRALAAAGPEHPRARRKLLVLDRDTAGEVSAPGIEVLPAYEWLLAGSAEAARQK